MKIEDRLPEGLSVFDVGKGFVKCCTRHADDHGRVERARIVQIAQHDFQAAARLAQKVFVGQPNVLEFELHVWPVSPAKGLAPLANKGAHARYFSRNCKNPKSFLGLGQDDEQIGTTPRCNE
ncbi:hypothetical protein D3C87_1599890 [compost metagenome]